MGTKKTNELLLDTADNHDVSCNNIKFEVNILYLRTHFVSPSERRYLSSHCEHLVLDEHSRQLLTPLLQAEKEK